jgi:polysaccharide biosynthesis protein PelD
VTEDKTAWSEIWAELKTWGGGSGLPVLPPLAALIELSVLVAFIVILDWAFPALGFLTVEPSPFWVPVLLLSLQYGTVAGLIAAAAATAAYVFNGVAEQVVGENFFSYLLRIWALPILWIGVALVLGQFRLRQIAEKHRLRHELEQRTVEAQTLAGYAKDLEGRYHRLERQLTTRFAQPITPVLDALTAIADPAADVDKVVSAITERLWPGAQASISAVEGDRLDVIAKGNWPATASFATELSNIHPLYRAIVVDKRSVCVLNTGDETVLAGLGLVACPIVAPDAGSVVGMLKIEVMDPALLTEGTAQHLEMVAQLLSHGGDEAFAHRPSGDARAIRAAAGATWLKRRWKPAAVSDTSPVQPASREDANVIDMLSRGLWPRRSS